jgi:hypothetical protein
MIRQVMADPNRTRVVERVLQDGNLVVAYQAMVNGQQVLVRVIESPTGQVLGNSFVKP